MVCLTLSVASPDAPLTLTRVGGVCRYNDRVRIVLSTQVGSIYRMGSSRYIECGVVDLSTGSDSSYRLAEVDISPSRPSAGDLPTPLAISVYRLREVGLPTRVGSVYRQDQGRSTDIPQLGIPTRASRSTDFADSVHRLCRRPRATTRTAAEHFRWASEMI